MNIRSIFEFAFALSIALSPMPALAQGPGGGGGFNPGDGGGGPGGGGSSGSFTYDSIASDVTNADHTVTRTDGGLLYRLAASPTAVSTPTNVTAIADGLFAGCTTLVTADLSATSIAVLPANCFAGCTALTTVILPGTCTAIGPGAFAGCTSLASVTAPAVATVGADAFRGCRALTSLPAFAEGAAMGDYAFAASGLATVDASGLVLGDGAFAGCESLATFSNAPDILPDALCSGCTALDFPDLAGKTLGAAALAGIPTTAFAVDAATTLGEGSLAAAEATLETTLDLADGALPVYDASAFLGRRVGFTPAGTDDNAPLGAFHLVTWLQEQAAAEAPLVDQPDTYNAADLGTWLARDGNAQTYAYASKAASGDSLPVLTVAGNPAGFVVALPDDGISVTVTPVACHSLSDDASGWSASNLVQDPDTGVYYPAEETDTCFAALLFGWDW